MLEAATNNGLDINQTENTPLLAGCSSKVRATRINTDWTQHSRTQRTQKSGKHSIRQKSLSSVRSIQSDISESASASRRRRPSPSFASKHRDTSAPPSSITLEGGEEILDTIGTTQRFIPGNSPRLLFKKFISSNISLRLENHGSVARDHLASERTFLAYMRTSLAIAASGVALVQLFSAASTIPQKSAHRVHRYVQPLGASTIIIGLIVLFIGIMRYFTIQSALTKGYFPVARLATGFIAVLLTVLVTLTFAILIAGKLTPHM